MFKHRAISFPLLLLLLALIIYWPAGGPYLFAVAAAAVFGMTVYEVSKMVGKIGMENYGRSTAVAGGVLFLCFLLALSLRADGCKDVAECLFFMATALFFLIFFSVWLRLLFASSGNRSQVLQRGMTSAGIFCLICFALVPAILVYLQDSQFPAGPVPLRLGSRQFLFLILVTKAMDTGGYIFGKLSSIWLPGGNHKIWPSVSPKKSWEGTIGGILFSVGVSLIFWGIYADAPFSGRFGSMMGTTLVWYLVAGIVLGIGSLAGDLTESALKRACGVKDSGALIPGMGGIFDVVDSFIYNGFLFFLLAAFVR